MSTIDKIASVIVDIGKKIKDGFLNNDIYLSYTRKDQNVADRICKKINLYGFYPYKLTYEGTDGNNVSKMIFTAIERAKVVIAIESSWSKDNDWCKKELDFAKSKGKKIIYILTDDENGLKGYRRMMFHYDLEICDKNIEEKLIFKLLSNGCKPDTTRLYSIGEQLYKNANKFSNENQPEKKEFEENAFLYMLRSADLGNENARSFIESKRWDIDIANVLSKYKLINASFIKELTENLYNRGEIIAEDETLTDVAQRGRGMERCAFKFMKRAIDLGYEGLDPRDYDWYFLNDQDFQECFDELGLSAKLYPKKEPYKSPKIIESNQNPQVFISYKRETKDDVFPIKDIIEERTQHKCWIDLDGIESDAQFANVIIKAINQAKVFLFMYSSKHTEIEDYENDWTIREINFAQKKKKRIVFVNIDGSKLTDWFELVFGTKQQIDAKSSKAMKKLCSDIQKWLSV